MHRKGLPRQPHHRGRRSHRPGPRGSSRPSNVRTGTLMPCKSLRCPKGLSAGRATERPETPGQNRGSSPVRQLDGYCPWQSRLHAPRQPGALARRLEGSSAAKWSCGERREARARPPHSRRHCGCETHKGEGGSGCRGVGDRRDAIGSGGCNEDGGGTRAGDGGCVRNSAQALLEKCKDGFAKHFEALADETEIHAAQGRLAHSSALLTRRADATAPCQSLPIRRREGGPQ